MKRRMTTRPAWPAPAWLAAAGILGAATAAAAAQAPLVLSGLQDRQRVDVTVYNQNVALVREERRLVLPQGEFVLEFRDVPAAIDPVTLLVEAQEAARFTLIEQNYEFDLMSKEKILQKYVGLPVSWIQEDGARVTGTLLGMSDGPVYEVGGEILFEVPGRIALPELPQNLRERPTLVWRAHAGRGGEAQLVASYLTGGMNWHADYVLQLDEAGDRGDLQAWVTVENRAGASFHGANLLLVAGDVNRAPKPRLAAMDVGLAEMRAGAAFSEETLYDYHLYTMNRPTDLLDQQIKQISLFEAHGVEVSKHYRLTAASPGYFRTVGALRQDHPVAVRYAFANRKDNELGMPLPGGVVRVYGLSAAGGRQFLGEQAIGHTPQDETVELTVGRAFDIVAERVRTEAVRVADDVFRTSFALTIRNHRRQDVTVEVVETVGGFWSVQASSLPYRKLSAEELAFDVPVPANGRTVLTYTVEVQN